MSLDEPLLAVATSELDDRLAQILDVFVEPGPQALLLEGSDEAFGAAVARWLAGERGAVFDAQPPDRALKVSGGVLRSPVVSGRDAAGDVGVDSAEAAGDGVVDRSRLAKRSPRLRP